MRRSRPSRAVKPSLAWAETYPGTLSYYLASAFGEVWMQPSGTVGLVGFATNALFLRDALDKAGIEAQFVARGEYKSAANLFTQDRYTDAHREADSRLLESLHCQVWQAVAESRGHHAGGRRRAGRPGATAARRRRGRRAGRPHRLPRRGVRADRRTGWRARHLGAIADAEGRRATAAVFVPVRPHQAGRNCRRCPSRAAEPKPTIAVVTLARPDRQRPRRPSVAAVGHVERGRLTPSPRRCGRRPPTTTSRPSCCGSTAPAVR